MGGRWKIENSLMGGWMRGLASLGMGGGGGSSTVT
jgi:hypothetical protein